MCPPRRKRRFRLRTSHDLVPNSQLMKCRPCSRGNLKCDYIEPCGVCMRNNRAEECRKPIPSRASRAGRQTADDTENSSAKTNSSFLQNSGRRELTTCRS